MQENRLKYNKYNLLVRMSLKEKFRYSLLVNILAIINLITVILMHLEYASFQNNVFSLFS